MDVLRPCVNQDKHGERERSFMVHQAVVSNQQRPPQQLWVRLCSINAFWPAKGSWDKYPNLWNDSNWKNQRKNIYQSRLQWKKMLYFQLVKLKNKPFMDRLYALIPCENRYRKHRSIEGDYKKKRNCIYTHSMGNTFRDYGDSLLHNDYGPETEWIVSHSN
jgi:hypothetical protein